jgi:DNA-binding NtrC family response regulator
MIVLVEDDKDQRTALRLALEQAGYEVREAGNAREALELEQIKTSKILITDIFMPEGDGFELIETVRRQFPSTKIIVISGGGTRVKGDYLSVAEMMCVDATLPKPFKVEALLEQIRNLVPAEGRNP